MNIHYARRMPSVSYAFGLFDEEKLIGVCTYGQPASPAPCRGIAGVENKKNVLELSRLVISPECTKKNCASYLIANSLRMLPNHTFVISYADWGGVASCRVCLSSYKLALYGNDETTNGYSFREWRTRKALRQGRDKATGKNSEASVCVLGGRQKGEKKDDGGIEMEGARRISKRRIEAIRYRKSNIG